MEIIVRRYSSQHEAHEFVRQAHVGLRLKVAKEITREVMPTLFPNGAYCVEFSELARKMAAKNLRVYQYLEAEWRDIANMSMKTSGQDIQLMFPKEDCEVVT